MKIPNWYLLLGPSLAFGIGFLMNAIAMAANQGQMPVLMPGGNAGLLDPDDRRRAQALPFTAG